MVTRATPSIAVDLVNRLGRERVRLAVFGEAPADWPAGKDLPGKRSIQQALWAKKLPSSWYAKVKILCDEIEIDCPMEAFSFKDPEAAEAADE